MFKVIHLRTSAALAVAIWLQIGLAHAQSITRFTKLLCFPDNPCTSSIGGNQTPPLPNSFTVPNTISAGLVKQLVVDFVSGDCIGTARTTRVILYATRGALAVGAKNDNFSANRFPMSVAQFNDTLGANAVQSFAMQTMLTYRPGTILSMSFDLAKGGNMSCRLQLNGYYITK